MAPVSGLVCIGSRAVTAAPDLATDLSRQATLDRAPALLRAFERAIGAVERVPRGVLPSEVFFVYATLGSYRPRQILESGRALGQSTRLLARCFPDVPLVSVEYDRDDPDAARALALLKGHDNIECLFGDSFDLLPPRVLAGDVAVIDGPKGLRALRLAYILLRRGAAVAFIHDCHKGSAIRAYLERNVPWAFFSDDQEFVRLYCRLDAARKPELLELWSDPARQPKDRSYGGTFACVPRRPGFPVWHHAATLRLARWGNDLRDWWLGGERGEPAAE